MSENEFRTGYAAIIGEPNAGKSTLMNAILETKLSIVTPKPQTTRKRVLGFLSKENYQIIFVDTPGLIKPKYLLQESMMQAAQRAISDADVVALILDADKVRDREHVLNKPLIDLLKSIDKPVIALLNKSDTFRDKKLLLPLLNDVYATKLFAEIIPISALKNEGTDVVVDTLVKYLPVHPPLYPVDYLSDMPERFFVSEIIREKIFQYYRDEIPYSTEVLINDFKERDDEADYIAADIVVERESQRKIIIGAAGRSIKEIGIRARKDIEEFLGKKVYLELYVKYRVGWRDDANWIQRFGYGE
jgi:GTPase